MGLKICLCLMLITLTRSNGDSSEESHQFAYNQAYAPSSMDFHDIYRPGQPQLASDLASTTSDEDFRYNTLSTQFVEFHPQVLKIQPITPPPSIILNSSYVKTTALKSFHMSSTTNEPDEMPIKEVPIRHYQRGVLDLLLPPPRVRAFKNVFNTIRRMLSYTFKKR